MMIVLKLAATNMGPVTLHVKGLGARPVVFRGGRNLVRYCLTKGQVVVLIYDGTSWVMANEATVPSVPPVVYVRPDGNDANSGDANTPGEALQTISAAIDKLESYVLPPAGGIVQLGIPGTYASVRRAFVGTISIIGDEANPEYYVISNSPGDYTPVALIGGTVTMRGVHLKNVTVNAWVVVFSINLGGTARCYNMILETTENGVYSFIADHASYLEIGTGCVLRSASLGAFLAQNGSQIVLSGGGTITIDNDATYSIACATAQTGSCITTSAGPISGNATGARYYCATNGVIWVNGDQNFFPGTIPGTADTNTGGRYA
ncbi:hypothetical protein GCM10011491_46540 [Brucella endophytica]|uniref:Uncharacterized protein n=1 Tax=Brucella endophytica TaxID=1963359 RepID=A0A916SRV7_9HYPH|nr:hypothetical protein [Brucella endophytica]GGB13545.1 hypothetical protein GCM10011491_46540 [Brucella endophytica]